MGFLSGLVEEEKLRPIIEKCFPSEQIVKAHRHIGADVQRGRLFLKSYRIFLHIKWCFAEVNPLLNKQDF
ncbi:hypothetical protein H7K21_14775 [Cytobacillus firmus]|nr:hypothetical protein [Cytobacillus firmus]